MLGSVFLSSLDKEQLEITNTKKRQVRRRQMISKSIIQDPVETDGDKYYVVLENQRVRVIRYHDKPGDRTSQHVHPDYVLYAESSFKRRLTFPDGRKQEVDVKAGSVVWMKGHIHIGENIGDTNTGAIIVELKEKEL
jgi:quercetin dioxygenase-like cupin family protein